MRVKNRKNKSNYEKETGQVTGEFDQHIGGLSAENILRHASAESGAKTLALGALHQDDKDHQQRHQGPNGK